MTVRFRNPYLRDHRRRLAAVVMALLCTLVARGQSAATPPYVLLEYSTLTGSGNTITASWVPVVTSGGTIYKDVTLQFDVDSAGNLTIAPGYPQVVPSPMVIVSSFQAGQYVGPNLYCSSHQSTIIVSGPGVAPGGATEWSLAATTACQSAYTSSATWYVGPLATNPLAARLSKAGITSTAWSYGIGSTANNNDGHWPPGGLLGLSQTGNALTIVSFTDGSGDHNLPVDQITYTLAP